MSIRLNSVPKIISSGLVSVVVGCKSLSALHVINCEKIGSEVWLEYLGCNGSLEELVVKNCKKIKQYDLLKFGPGWMKLQKFVFERKNNILCGNSHMGYKGYDPSYDAHNLNIYDFCCESLKDLRLAHFETGTEIGLCFLLGRCKALEKLCLDYVCGLNDKDMIVLSQSCSNLKSISLWLFPQLYHGVYRTSFTDDSLKALALRCTMLLTVKLTFTDCGADWPTEIGFTQKGLLVLIQSCPIRVLVLNGVKFLNVHGMKALLSAPFLEKLELVDCKVVTDTGMRFIACTPRLIHLTLQLCEHVTDGGVAELVRAHTLESLIIEGCPGISEQALHGAARSVRYSVESACRRKLKRMYS